jgi:hypothetical protein
VTGFKGIGFIGLDFKGLGFKQKCLTTPQQAKTLPELDIARVGHCQSWTLPELDIARQCQTVNVTKQNDETG